VYIYIYAYIYIYTYNCLPLLCQGACYKLNIELAVPLEGVLLQCDVPVELLDTETNGAIMSKSQPVRSYIHIYTYIFQGAPLRLPKPLSDQFPLRVCSCALCIITVYIKIYTCVCMCPAAVRRSGGASRHGDKRSNHVKVSTGDIYLYV